MKWRIREMVISDKHGLNPRIQDRDIGRLDLYKAENRRVKAIQGSRKRQLEVGVNFEK